MPNHTLLVVDADTPSAVPWARRLERRGTHVVPVATGRQAMAYLAAHAVSAAVVDARLPDASGLQVLQSIREIWSADELPVLIMFPAGHVGDDITTAIDLGANDVLTKPMEIAVALARIQTQFSRRDADVRLRASEERYALAARGANDGLWDWDLITGQLTYSARWMMIVGCGGDDASTGPDEWFGRVHAEDRARLRRDLDAHLTGRTPHFENEHRLRHKAGAFRWVLTRGLAVRDGDGRPVRMAGSLSDITAGKVVDALTGLPNRMLLLDRLERVLHHHRVHAGGQFAVLFLDLDGFKAVNDTLGHIVGDELLQSVARRLEASLRHTDSLGRPALESGGSGFVTEHTLARLGGDEFVVLLHDVRGVVDATRVADRIQRVLARPFDLGGREVITTASIGIAVGAASHVTPEDVLRDADTAMYRAKALGKGRAEVFDATMREQVVERRNLDRALRLALERHEFLPYYQPIVHLQTGRLEGFEALLRWQHPERGIVSPAEFVAAIQENGLVVPIGRRFFADVCRQLREWRNRFPAAARIAVNVNFAGQELIEAGLIDNLIETLDDEGLEPEHFVVEITESTVLANLPQAGVVLRRIRDAGLRVVLDDFGTGHSALSCLHELPMNGLKLDRTFIVRESRHPAILRAIIVLAEQLGLTVTAEGIETVAQFEQLRDLGCTFAQGYLFAPALSAEAAGEWLSSPDRALPIRQTSEQAR